MPVAPVALLAVRIRLEDSPEAIVSHGLRVNFRWLGDEARIDEIESMSAGPETYVMDLLVVEAP